ncbi:choice-of-anchor D domain-containing protein [Burkholderia cenocepacia]|uniref:choice-of-anchor D domain-containing protein n=1 Tax=Burkholderia cenocepacia TaxID=95486 RepID=UPI00076111E4|nr:choice-of-anchor D domain-containing protein [Burkholderia cenocepacia]KWU26400.1 hypothetical protein AS149_25775 [Burkholderia cenocepacia]
MHSFRKNKKRFAALMSAVLVFTSTVTPLAEAANQFYRIPLKSDGVAPGDGKVQLSPGSIAFADQYLETTSGAQTVVLTNLGSTEVTVGDANLSGPFAVSTTCGATLTATASCTYSLTFSPVAMGSAAGTLAVPTSAGAQTVSLTGYGLKTSDSTSIGSLSFQQPVNTTSAAKTVTLTNTGNTPVKVNAVTIGGSAFNVAHSCPSSIAAGASCDANVTFSPTAMGDASGTLTFDTAAGKQLVVLSGTGLLAVPKLSVSQLEFGNQTVNSVSGAQIVTLTNAGNTSMGVLPATADAPFALKDDSCTTSLSAGASCAMSVTFAPVEMDGAAGKLHVPLSTGDLSVDLTGNGLQTSGAVDNTGLSFGDVGVGTTSAVQSVVLNNTGNTPLVVSKVFGTGPFGVTHNCATVAAGANCVVSSTFQPVAMGAANGAITVATNGGTFTVAESGNGLLAKPVFDPGSLSFPDQVVSTTSVAQTVTLTNNGNTPTALAAAQMTGPFASSTTCSASLAAGASCTYYVTYTPTVMNGAAGTLAVQTDVGIQTVTLVGRGLQTSGALDKASLAFGNVPVSSISAGQAVKLTNTGNTTLNIKSIAATANFGASGDCGTAIPVNGACTINVTYSPSAIGDSTGTLSVATDGGTYTSNLAGTGLLAIAGVNPSSLSFGNQAVNTTSAAQSVTLSNTGNTSMTVATATSSGPFAIATNCSPTLAAGASCSYTVKFTPVAMNAASGTLTIPTGAGSKTVALNGFGQQVSGSLDKSSLAFGNQAVGVQSATQVLKLTNTGNLPLPVSSISTTSQYSVTHTCGTSVAVGATCTLTVAFSPTAIGAQNGSVTVATSGGNYGATLTGTGLLAIVAASPTSLDFGTQTVGSSSVSKTVTLSNTGNTAASVSGATVTGPFAVSTTCGSSITAGASCSYSVTFTPTAMNGASGTLTIPTGAGTKTVSLAGNGQQTSAALPEGTLAFGNQPVNVVSTAQTLTLNNTGNTPYPVNSISVQGQFTAQQDCPAQLAVGASCHINVAFLPSSMGATTGTLSMVTGDGTHIVTLTGTGLLAVASVSPAALSFGNQTVNTTSAPQTVTLTNTGNTAMTVSTPTGNLSGPWSTNCPATLAGGASCTMTVTFLPQSMGPITQQFSMNTSAGNKTVTVTGTGMQTSGSLSASTLAFGNQGVGTTSASKSVTLTNTGNAALGISTVSASNQFTSANNCGSSVAVGASCTVTVAFAPTASGAQSGTLSVATAGGTYTASLSGTGLLAATSVNPSSLAFGSQTVNTTSAVKTVTLSNTGNTSSALSGASITGPFAVSNNCPASLAAGGSCTFSLTYTPKAMTADTGTLSVPTDVGTKTVSLSGQGLQTSGSVSPSSLAFGNVAVSTTSAVQTVTLSNTGNTALGVSSVSTTGPFAASHNCGSSLASGSCAINVTFTPGSMGSQAGTLSVATAAGTYTTSLSGTGLQAATSVNPTSLTYGAQVVGTTSGAQAVTLSNTGNTATSVSAASVSGPFALSTTCGSSIAGGAACTYSVTFTPTAMNGASGTLTIPTGVGTRTVTLSGTGQQAALSANPTSVAFGNVQVAQSASKTFTVTNTGNIATSGFSVSVPAGYSQSNTCGSSLASGASCTVTTVFAPGAAQAYSGSVSVSGGNASTSVAVSGTGTNPSLINTSGSGINMGANLPADTSAAQNFVFQNNGSGPVTITTGGMVTGNLNFFTGSCTNGTVLSPGQTCLLQLYMAGAGSYSGTGYLNSSAGQLQFSAYGTAVAPTFTAANLGTIKSNQTNAVWVTVTNPAADAFRNVSISAAAPYYISSNNCSTTIAAGGTCSFILTFNPQGSVGTWNGGYVSMTGFHYQTVNGAEVTSWQPGNAQYWGSVTGTSQQACVPGAAAWGGPTVTTFDPNTAGAKGCTQFLVVTVGGGGAGGYYNGTGFARAAGGGGSGYVSVQWANFSGPVTMTAGAGGDVAGTRNGGTSCLGAYCAGGGNSPVNTSGYGGAGGSGGGGGFQIANGYGGAWGNNSSDGTGAGQGNYQPYVALFRYHSVTGGAGAAPATNGAGVWVGGGAGGVLFDGTGPSGSAGYSGASVASAGGVGWGAGGGTGIVQCTRQCIPGGAGNGAPGLVYVEWYQ